jgi:hypothetical protein
VVAESELFSPQFPVKIESRFSPARPHLACVAHANNEVVQELLNYQNVRVDANI